MFVKAVADIFATHPPIAKRIELLRGMAYALDAQ
jgi:Zn-dependent protease with chaperone function